jgi:hypothetical protein
MTVLIYVDTSKQDGDPDHLKLLANAEAAAACLRKTVRRFWTVQPAAHTSLGRSRWPATAHPGVQLIQSKVQLIARNVATPKKETHASVAMSVTKANVIGKMYCLAGRPTEGNREPLCSMAVSPD